MSNLTQYTYPFDPTGTNPANKVVGERHVVSTVGSDFRLIIPKCGPYFKDSLVVKHVATGATLNPGLDYEHSLYFEALSETEPYPSVFGGISLKTSAYDGATLELAEYQSVGGEHVLAESSIATILANMLQDPRTARWDDVTYKPGVWTPDSHLTSLEETVGYGELVQAVRDLADNYNLQTSQLVQMITAHVGDTNDPHSTQLARTKASLLTASGNLYWGKTYVVTGNNAYTLPDAEDSRLGEMMTLIARDLDTDEYEFSPTLRLKNGGTEELYFNGKKDNNISLPPGKTYRIILVAPKTWEVFQ